MAWNDEIEKLRDVGSQKIMEEFNEFYNKYEEGHQFARAYCLEIEKQFGTKPNYTIRRIK